MLRFGIVKWGFLVGSLAMPEQVEALIHFVTTEPDPADDKKTQFMHPYKSSEVLPGPCCARLRAPLDPVQSCHPWLALAGSQLQLVVGDGCWPKTFSRVSLTWTWAGSERGPVGRVRLSFRE